MGIWDTGPIWLINLAVSLFLPPLSIGMSSTASAEGNLAKPNLCHIISVIGEDLFKAVMLWYPNCTMPLAVMDVLTKVNCEKN